jgi:tripartite-type tricarboxylate transporter receptor subunit TctC
MAEALHTPEIAKQLRDFSMRAVGSTPADTRAFLKTETERWHEVVVAAGLRQE